jgi:outer membrane lipoprotein carrier protein
MTSAMQRLSLAALTGVMLACLARPAPAADDAVTRVQTYLSGVKTLAADFVQVVRNSQGQITERATGTLSLARPDRFRWDYREPYQQVIVADAHKLWLYDTDLQQVTVRDLEEGLGSTPAMLLSGAGRIGDSFRSLGVDRDDGWTWCRLAPLAADADFERVSLAFGKGDELTAMELVDKLGQTTRIDFATLRRNVAIDDATFHFAPPAGVDVIGDAGT